MRKLMAAALAALLLLTGCASGANGGATLAPAGSPTPEATRAPGATAEALGFLRLPLVRREETYGGNALIYPAVETEGYDVLNAAVYRKLLAGLAQMSAPVYTYFNVKCNEGGVLSLLFSYYDLQTSELYLKLPVTLDVATGGEIALENCFDPENEAWRSVVPDVIRRQAESIGMLLLSDVLPMENGQLFYLTSHSVVILYRPYEITTYLGGWPEFSVSYETLLPHFDEHAAVMRLMKASAEAAQKEALG